MRFALVVLALASSLPAALAGERAPAPWPGYTLVAPIGSTTTYLLDLAGNVVHRWESDCEPGQSVYLLPNGHLLRTGSVGRENPTFRAGGAGGRIQEFTFEGEIVWDFTLSTESVLLHHDIAPLPNGHVLAIAWERKSAGEMIAAGRDPSTVPAEGMWCDAVYEVKPTGRRTGEIVWEWHVYDHLASGDAAADPRRIDVNVEDWAHRMPESEFDLLKSLGYLGGSTTRRTNPDWNHTNSIDWDPRTDRIALSVLGMSEIWILDHSISAAEAKGRAGDILRRYGNPAAYGGEGERTLFAQHDARFIPEGLPGAGHLLVFNNGRGRPGGDFSSVDEIAEDGRLVWSYRAKGFYSGHISGAERLPDGHTLVCEGEKGRLFEVTPGGEVVWEWVNPIATARPGALRNELFRASRIGLDHPALRGRDLAPIGPLDPGKDSPDRPARGPGPGRVTDLVEAGTRPKRVASGLVFGGGPAADAAGNFFFSDAGANRIYRFGADGSFGKVREETGGANGLWSGPGGLLYACEGNRGRVVRYEADGTTTVLAAEWAGKRLNRPNDLWVGPDGAVWFTDPAYNTAPTQDAECVYRIAPDGRLTRVAADLVRPNGIAGTPDGKTLYVTDADGDRTWRYRITEEGTLVEKTLFVEASAAGLALDGEGNVYLAEGVVRIYAPDGTPRGEIPLPERPTDLAFGGPDGRTLLVTTRTMALAFRTRPKGAGR